MKVERNGVTFEIGAVADTRFIVGYWLEISSLGTSISRSLNDGEYAIVKQFLGGLENE